MEEEALKPLTQFERVSYFAKKFIPDATGTYDEIIEQLVAYFDKDIDDFISCLSFNTLSFIRQILETKDRNMGLKLDFVGDDDFILLMDIGVISMKTMRLETKYRKVARKALKQVNIDKIVYAQTLFKGLMDIYGYIDMKTLKVIANRYLPKPVTLEILYQMYKGTRLITFFGHVTRKYVARDEIMACKKDFLIARDQECKEPYALFSEKEILEFSSTFDLKGNFPYNTETAPVGVMSFARLFALAVEIDHDLMMVFANQDMRKCEEMMSYEANYPKWIFKGHTRRFIQDYLPFEKMIGEEKIYA